jgi:hypothetical protein
VTPDDFEPGAVYRVLEPFEADGQRVDAGRALRFVEAVYNREDGSWLYQLMDAAGPVWLVEADPLALRVLRDLDRYLQRTARS